MLACRSSLPDRDVIARLRLEMLTMCAFRGRGTINDDVHPYDHHRCASTPRDRNAGAGRCPRWRTRPPLDGRSPRIAIQMVPTDEIAMEILTRAKRAEKLATRR